MKFLQPKIALCLILAANILLCCCEVRNLRIVFDDASLMGIELDLSAVEIGLPTGSTATIPSNSQPMADASMPAEMPKSDGPTGEVLN
jgi:hypothetical protein